MGVSKLFLSFLLLLGLTFAELTISEDGAVIFPAKDATNFDRERFSDDGPSPVSLVLIEEKIFIAVGVSVSEATLVAVEVSRNGGPKQAVDTFNFTEKGDFEVFSSLEDFLSAKERGDNTFTLFLTEVDAAGNPTGAETLEASVEVYAITNFLSVFPLIMLVVLAMLARNVYVSMFFGIWIGSLVIAKGDIVISFKELFDVHMIPSITDDFNFRTITFTLFLAGFIAMIQKAGGQDGFSEYVGRYATSPRKTQLAAVAAGVGLFFDDYSSVLILGSSFKKLTDRFYVSREKLAFVADATSAPIASIAPISSWIAFELSRIGPELDNIQKTSGFSSKDDLPAEYPFFLNTIPSRYYPFYMLVIQVALILAGVEFGPMLYAERKTRLGKRTDGGDGRMEIPVEQDYTTPADDTPRKAWNFFVPLGFFIISLLVSLVNIGKANIDATNADNGPDEQIDYIAREIFGNTDSFAALVYTTMGASLFCLIFFLIQFKKDGEIVMPSRAALIDAIDCRIKSADDVAIQEGIELNAKKSDQARPILYFTEGINVWVEGFKNLVPAILILCMAFTIKSIVSGCATDRFFTNIILESNLSAEALPTIIFVVACLLSLCTGTSFGTMSIMFPLVSFATFEKAEGDIDLFTVALSSIMAGAIFGDHSSLISDTTILASIGSGCSIGSHVYTQFPYALWGAFWSIVLGTVPAGYGANAGVMLAFGMIIVSIITILVSAPIVAKSGRLDVFSELMLKSGFFKGIEDFKQATKEFAQLNPDFVDEEPIDWIKRVILRRPGVPFDSILDTDAEEKAKEMVVKSEEVEAAEPVKNDYDEAAEEVPVPVKGSEKDVPESTVEV